MSENVQIMIGLVFLAGIFILTRFGIAWRMQKAAETTLHDLRMKRAFDPASAVHLPYERAPLLRFGMRDFRPKVLTQMVSSGVLGRTEDGRYYLRNPAAAPMGPGSGTGGFFRS